MLLARENAVAGNMRAVAAAWGRGGRLGGCGGGGRSVSGRWCWKRLKRWPERRGAGDAGDGLMGGFRDDVRDGLGRCYACVSFTSVLFVRMSTHGRESGFPRRVSNAIRDITPATPIDTNTPTTRPQPRQTDKLPPPHHFHTTRSPKKPRRTENKTTPRQPRLNLLQSLFRKVGVVSM